MPGLHTTPPDVQTAPSPTSRRDRPDLQRELGRSGERVAALVHRRRARVRGLALPGDLVALDAERAEHDAEREVHGLEHRPLLDVELEIGDGVRELRAGLGRAVEIDAVRGERVRKRDAVRVASPAQLLLIRHRA